MHLYEVGVVFHTTLTTMNTRLVLRDLASTTVALSRPLHYHVRVVLRDLASTVVSYRQPRHFQLHIGQEVVDDYNSADRKIEVITLNSGPVQACVIAGGRNVLAPSR